jgi:heme oxygenase (biliverdin-IX-beta and delta-forming)
MIERLNEETRVHHAEAEADFDILFDSETTPAHYLKFLVRVYGFEAPLESTLAMTPNLELMIDLKERQKAGYLAQDLMALGLRPAQIAELPQCLTIPQFRGAAEALGWMFVVERTTLAHSVLRRHLLTRLPKELRAASNYLSAYTGVVGSRWRQFGATLDDVARHPAIADRVIVAANDAFKCQRRWIQQDLTDVRAAI